MEGTSQAPISSSKYFHPYFTPAEVESLSAKQRGKLSVSQEERIRQTACSFLETLGSRIGFPRRTIVTAQVLYHRFHLFFPRKDFNYVDVALAALYVSTKMNDTLKKPRELLALSYALRYPDLVAKSKNPAGEVDLDTMDPQARFIAVETDRQRLLGIERLIMETICFNFTSKVPFPYVIKLGKALRAPKILTKSAWRISIDVYRTLLPIQYPPHTIALGSIFVAALLATFEKPPAPESSDAEGYQVRNSHEIVAQLKDRGSWEEQFHAQVEDLEVIAHTVLDLLIHVAQSPQTNTSPRTPRTPSSPSTYPSPRDRQQLINPNTPLPYHADYLLRLKIALREHEHPQRPRQPLGTSDPSALYSGDDATMLGRSEGTIRFLFGPPGTLDS
ncbi:cyclin-like protein [Fistulina hepatica ATCC 64428]|uniref:Cyclin-like protein n=1 Tax=Fistulina hepatica ATCC 64428 TaxID=1128425 RepID=A0A0D7AGW3_9AGAR|nr:cyclin-like protein [Fistulina hepatica ATCC 64428]